MRIAYHRHFLKNFKKRILPYPKLVAKFEERLRLRLDDPSSPVLWDHQLAGSKSEYRSFSITGNIRVVYKIEGNILKLYDIGTHNQVY
jgi:addiction module RelE/StbE family toxin